MKRCLVDVNLVLALLVRQHVHHTIARDWFAGRIANEVGLCRLVQLALVRLLANRSIMANDAVPATAGWQLIADLLEDERLDFLAEPLLIDSYLPAFLGYPVSPAKLVTDAYLAAFAMASSRQLVTLDRDFRRFRGLDVLLLG